MDVNAPLWAPSAERVAASAMTDFRQWCADRFKVVLTDHEALHQWSIDHRDAFWIAVWDYCGVKGDKGGVPLAADSGAMLDERFFPDGALNFAENLLASSGETDALLFRGEDKVGYRWSWDHLRALVSRLQQAYRAMGIGKGDRISAMMPNIPETVACMLAASSIGAIWSSCSPDFGEQGLTDRFGQVEPKLFICCDAYWYNGKLQDVSAKVRAIEPALKAPLVVVHYAGDADALAGSLADGRTLDAFVSSFQARAVEFEPLPFRHPLYILFSSGTTGAPKCIVHSQGGTLLQHLKEHRLHCDLKAGERFFYFTTCGWMMWNWLVSGLASGATLCLYDGSPFAPGPDVLWNYADEERFAFFGTSAKYIDAVRKSGFEPRKTHRLADLRLVASTGSTLSPEGFSFVYEGIKPDVQLASISGGTDIASCFVLGNPVKPVWRGEIQGPGLGLAIDVWNDEGKPVRGEKGDLVCTRAFPCMPVGFWNDAGGLRYKAAYFERFGNVWCHGDFAEWTEHGGFIIHGRSDATLNPGGVRIGTAEIYNQVEQLDEVVEAICIGQDWDNDVRVVLFVRLETGLVLDAGLEKKIKSKIRTGASPRHVPAKVIQVAEIPRTKSGKIVELAVREVVHGRPVKNLEALANPEALELFAGLEELQK